MGRRMQGGRESEREGRRGEADSAHVGFPTHESHWRVMGTAK